MLEELRIQIDAVDAGLASLFAKRMEMVRQVAETKRGGALVLDENREAQVREQFLSRIPAELEIYADQLLDTLLAVSKDYQKDLLS